ncbi:hypothetical protein QWJ90_00210 [Microbacterium oryzae]|uniref:hypothetical protein n=1 Tax=Microbacterium oryzae TaxID=743009 RepID=UPI0025B02F2A|nr:hypothetical protein [Microbacterium oryzae]MDN3309350.1 hypothetical protein [Microbacterium oryzae]
MAGGLKPVRHETLDELPPSTRLRYFRRTLIAAGCLPEIDVRLHDLALRTESFIQTLPADHAVIVARYFSWETLRKLRRRPLDRPVSVGVVNTRTTEVRKIAAFLAWLDENDVELETLQQVALDRYLAHRDPHRALARFLRWAVHHRVMPRVRLPPTPRVERGPATNADALWDHVDVLLHDETTPLPSRIIGLFLLVFAQPISDSARLRRDAVQGYGEELTVRFGTTPVKMPPPIASLLQQHLAEAGNRRPYVGQPSAWLFPGTMPQQHVTEDAVRGHLAKHGFHARAAKRARLHQLTQVLPASIVADITGYAVQTAVRHAAKSGAAWGAYPELRESETSELDGHK